MEFSNISACRRNFNVSSSSSEEPVIGLAGNPNTGKSTIFNTLTGMKQHTGNWPGKTVLQAQGSYKFGNRKYTLVDLPGTYSLFANSPDEQTARDFICFARPDVTVVVTDATCLERNLNLVLQVMEITPQVIVCVNLIDEAEKKNILIDVRKLSAELGVPVVATVARAGRGIDELKKIIRDMAEGKIKTIPRLVKYDHEIESKIREIETGINNIIPNGVINSRWLALRLLDGEYSIIQNIKNYFKVRESVVV